MNTINRVNVIVLDSVGIGTAPDSGQFGDEGAATLPHIAEKIENFKLPNLEQMGLGNITNLEGINKVDVPSAAYGKMEEQSNGKDTTIGHWELAGIISKEPLPTYPNGFPNQIMDKFHQAIGRESLGNKPASGTVIIEELGQEHIETGKPIVYTSGDSVFQIAAHEDVIPIDELYHICKEARAILTGEHAVARVIARPFVGEVGDFTRTDNRNDYSLMPPQKTILDYLKEASYDVIGVGKIENIFSGQGITASVHTHDNMDGVNQTIKLLKEENEGLLFTNLVDFDMKYGHRRNVEGYAKALINFDNRLPEIIAALRDDDLLMITADHGCDPTYKGTDHTREYVPLLVYGKSMESGVDLGIRGTFSDVAATIADIFEIEGIEAGKSFKEEIITD